MPDSQEKVPDIRPDFSYTANQVSSSVISEKRKNNDKGKGKQGKYSEPEKGVNSINLTEKNLHWRMVDGGWLMVDGGCKWKFHKPLTISH
jgi:hypothetical protein